MRTTRVMRPTDPRRTAPPEPGGGGRAGFGLIEAIVALAIAGVVLAAVTEIAGRTLRSWNRGFSTVAAIERTDVAIGRLAADLTSLLPIRLATADDAAVLFAGDEHGMSFTAFTPLDRAEEGIAVIEIAVERGPDGAVLARRLRRGRDVGLRDGDRVVLLSGRLDLAFSYRDRAGQRVDRWARPGEVPRGVVVTLKGGREGGGLPVEVMLPIPVSVAVSCLVTAPSDAREEASPTEESTAGPRRRAAPPPAGEGDPPRTPEGRDDRGRRCAGAPGASGAPAARGDGDPSAPPGRRRPPRGEGTR